MILNDNLKIAILQSGPPHTALLTGALLVGLHKHYPSSKVVWIGQPEYFGLVRYNKRVQDYISIQEEIGLATLPKLHGIDLCINLSYARDARNYASCVPAKWIRGFTKKSTTDREVNFLQNVLSGDIATKHHILELYYQAAGLEWKGEGYGLGYYPKNKQHIDVGQYSRESLPDIPKIHLPKPLMKRLDVLNKYQTIHTDDHFVLHAGLALRKEVIFYSPPLSYQIEFFKKGKIIRKESV